jgi:hypothetical protein
MADIGYGLFHFPQFVSMLGIVRFIGQNDVIEARVGWKATDNVAVTFEALNIFDEPKRQVHPGAEKYVGTQQLRTEIVPRREGKVLTRAA